MIKPIYYYVEGFDDTFINVEATIVALIKEVNRLGELIEKNNGKCEHVLTYALEDDCALCDGNIGEHSMDCFVVTGVPKPWTPRYGEQVYIITSAGDILLTPFSENGKAKKRAGFLGCWQNNAEGKAEAEAKVEQIKAMLNK